MQFSRRTLQGNISFQVFDRLTLKFLIRLLRKLSEALRGLGSSKNAEERDLLRPLFVLSSLGEKDCEETPASKITLLASALSSLNINLAQTDSLSSFVSTLRQIVGDKVRLSESFSLTLFTEADFRTVDDIS